MAVKLKLTKPAAACLSSYSLEKFIKTHKNLSRSTTPTRLWLDDLLITHQGFPILTQTHPILHKLDHCNIANLKEFNQVHAQLLVSGLFQHSLAASRVIKKLCSSPATVSHAVSLFNHFDEPDSFLCNTIIRALANSKDPHRALSFYYRRMIGKFVTPNHYTFPVLVKVCAQLGLVREGEKAHGHAFKLGFELDLYVQNALIHLYSVCGMISCAWKVFDLAHESDMVTWNSMIDGCVKNGEVGLARHLFDEMPERDAFSWNSMISGYAGVGDMDSAKELFDKMPDREIISWNSLIDGYARIGDIVAARKFFDWMPCKNMVSWNTMLTAYVRLKDYNACLLLFDKMLETIDTNANKATLMSVLTACAHSGRLDTGKWVHSYIDNNKHIEPDVLLSTALLTMYAKCGAMDLAETVFSGMPERSVVSWNSMIMGYGMNGDGEKALEMFLDMEKSGVLPNDATFVCILSACTHAGMVLEGWWYFDLMRQVYNIEPKVEHYGCMVDLLGRIGLVKDFKGIISNMTSEAGSDLWEALHADCRTHSYLELGEILAKRLIELEPRDIGPYVLLSSIYAAEDKWENIEHVREMMMEKQGHELAGSNLIHSGASRVQSFVENHSAHRKRLVYSMLSEMGAQMKLSCRNLTG